MPLGVKLAQQRGHFGGSHRRQPPDIGIPKPHIRHARRQRTTGIRARFQGDPQRLNAHTALSCAQAALPQPVKDVKQQVMTAKQAERFTGAERREQRLLAAQQAQ